MKNKGFTLVELLAVIAILAILVIVAMPNVLEMFNQAKVNTFVTEVQKIMDTSTSQFTQDAIKNSGQTVYYSSVDNPELKTSQLNISGAEKDYFICSAFGCHQCPADAFPRSRCHYPALLCR